MPKIKCDMWDECEERDCECCITDEEYEFDENSIITVTHYHEEDDTPGGVLHFFNW